MKLSDILSVPASGDHFLIRDPRIDIPFTPDDSGFWAHPDFRWSLVPDETDMHQYFRDAGFDLMAVTRDEDIADQDQCCRGWLPESPGEGWFLVLVVDSEDGPQAAFARRKQNR